MVLAPARPRSPTSLAEGDRHAMSDRRQRPRMPARCSGTAVGQPAGRLLAWVDRFLRRPAAAAAMLLWVVAGCGDSGGPELDDSAHSFIAAQQALARGDTEKAMQQLTASITARPDAWAYYQRAKLYADAGNDRAALADCQAGLQLDPENANLHWLDRELKKTAGQRFKGTNAQPPSAKK